MSSDSGAMISTIVTLAVARSTSSDSVDLEAARVVGDSHDRRQRVIAVARDHADPLVGEAHDAPHGERSEHVREEPREERVEELVRLPQHLDERAVRRQRRSSGCRAREVLEAVGDADDPAVRVGHVARRDGRGTRPRSCTCGARRRRAWGRRHRARAAGASRRRRAGAPSASSPPATHRRGRRRTCRCREAAQTCRAKRAPRPGSPSRWPSNSE